ncbi:hypothetical protein N8368_01550, partial [Bacteroidia bacterium]|nr:hypothetical protein [Bacteroidia bacterium]
SAKVDTIIKKIVPKKLRYYAFKAEVTDATSGEKISNFSYAILPNSRAVKETAVNELIIDTLAFNESYVITLKKENYFPISDTLKNITADINKS